MVLVIQSVWIMDSQELVRDMILMKVDNQY